VSDVRALLAGRAIEMADGIYPERDDKPAHSVEEWLRACVSYLPDCAFHASGKFTRQVNMLDARLRGQDDDALRGAMLEIAARMQTCGLRDDLVAQAFARVREASRRVLEMRHYDEQLLAGRALLRGKVAEMATGEGKTLAATLSACTVAATGAAVHVVTVNDYLARRDAENNTPLYQFFGLSVGAVEQGMSIDERQRQYARDVVYVSNKELTFDYLKDHIALGSLSAAQLKLRRLQGMRAMPRPILRGLHMAIVDEADSVLIDEARTPLIISETLPGELGEAIYHQSIELARQLESGRHFRLRDRDVWLTPEGEMELTQRAKMLGGVWESALWRKELATQALSALHLFHCDQHYILADGKVQIVDEFTGRVMPDRTWEHGLHQMIEAKEHCEMTGQRRTLSQITYQRFFGRYLLLSGMTGTASEVASELKRIYDLSVVRIPTHRPSRRTRLPDRVFRNADERWRAVAERAREIAGEGRAVLIGTRSVEASERLSALLAEQGVPHTVLNARQDKAEADAVAQAGRAGQITVATNMAGRGTDIKPDTEVEQRGGLHVILTEFHEAARIDRQLFGRSARQGNPGTVEAIISLEDDLFLRFIPRRSKMKNTVWPHPVWNNASLFRALTAFAQSRAEAYDRRIRLDAVRRDREWFQALGFVGRHRK
jgi:preprotein translocase subunit SecA